MADAAPVRPASSVATAALRPFLRSKPTTTAAGDLVVPSEGVRLSLVPGQRVRVTVSAAGHRRNMYGALAGQLPDVSADEIADERREVWGYLADRQ